MSDMMSVLVIIFMLYLSVRITLAQTEDPAQLLRCAEGPKGSFIGEIFCQSGPGGDSLLRAKLELTPGMLSLPYVGSAFPEVEAVFPESICVVVSSCLATRDEAKRFCSNYVGMLVMLDSERQRKNVEEITAISSPLSRVYFTDIKAAANGKWIWESTGKEVPTTIVPAHTYANPSGISLAYARESGIAMLQPINDTNSAYFMCQQFPPKCVKRVAQRSLKKNEEGQDKNAGIPSDTDDYSFSTCKAGQELARRICYQYQNRKSDLVAYDENDELNTISNIFGYGTDADMLNYTFWTSGSPTRKNDKREDVFFISSNAEKKIEGLIDNTTLDGVGVATNVYVKKGSAPVLKHFVVDIKEPFFFVCEDCSRNAKDLTCSESGLREKMGQEIYDISGNSSFSITARLMIGACNQMKAYGDTGKIPQRLSPDSAAHVPEEKCGFYKKSFCGERVCGKFVKGICQKNHRTETETAHSL